MAGAFTKLHEEKIVWSVLFGVKECDVDKWEAIAPSPCNACKLPFCGATKFNLLFAFPIEVCVLERGGCL